jgi:ketosteroid isomerase-like protein
MAHRLLSEPVGCSERADDITGGNDDTRSDSYWCSGAAWRRLGCTAADDFADSRDVPVATTGESVADVERTIAQLEQQWVDAILAKDTATIDRLLAADFVGTTNDRRYIKRQAIEDVRAGTHDVLRLEDVQVRLYGDTAIVDVDQTEQSRHGDDDFSGSYMFTNVWVKQDGQWRAVASPGSRIR